MKSAIKVEFQPSGRGKARCPSNAEFPDGKDIDACCEGESGEWVELPYPAPECGAWIVGGEGFKTIAITTAGRPDDPRNAKIPHSIPNPNPEMKEE